MITRPRLAAVIAALAITAFGTTAFAGHLAGGVKSYTGCIPSGDGPIIKIKEGNAPLSPCTSGQTQVHFSGGGWDDIGVKNTRLVALRIG